MISIYNIILLQVMGDETLGVSCQLFGLDVASQLRNLVK